MRQIKLASLILPFRGEACVISGCEIDGFLELGKSGRCGVEGGVEGEVGGELRLVKEGAA